MYKILLVDDDKALLERFYRFIEWEKYGFEVVARLLNGRKAFEYIKETAVDVVITDIKMPDMDGIELAGKIRESFPDIEVVFVSAFCDFHYARHAVKYGVVDYISKPVLFEDVEEVLQNLYRKLSKKSNKGSADEESTAIIAKRKEIFCRFLNSKILEIDSFKEEFAGVKIQYRSLYSKCALVTFEVIGMEENLTKKWENDKEKMKESIVNVICVDTKKFYTVQLDFSDNILSVLYVSKEDTAVVEERISAIINKLWEMYELIAVNENFLMFDSLNAFKEKLIAARSGELKSLKSKIAVRSDEQMVADVVKYIKEHYAEDIDIDIFINKCHYTEQYIARLFKKVMGKTFHEYLNEIRIENAKRMLMVGENIEIVLSKVGFGSRRHFEKQFMHYTGQTPGQYRKNKMREKQ